MILRLVYLNLIVAFAIFLFSKVLPHIKQKGYFVEITCVSLIAVNVALVNFSTNDPNTIRLLYVQVVLIYFLLTFLTNKERLRENVLFFAVLFLIAILLPDLPEWLRSTINN